MYQGGRPQIYSVEEVQTVGDVSHKIPHTYATLDNRKMDNQASIIQMEEKLCDQVVSIMIDPRYNYSYVSPDLSDECGLNK